jgi:hypothetical protein
MKHCWVVEYCDNGEWLLQDMFFTRLEARGYARECRYNWGPGHPVRTVKYVPEPW